LVALNDGFAKAKAIENKQELVLEHAQKMVNTGGSDGLPAAATRAPEKAFSQARAEPGYVPATKNDARRLRIFSAIDPTARSSALSHARC